MAINFGAFAGAVGKSALDTYTRLNAEAREARKAGREEEAYQKEQALDALYAEKLGRVGKDVSTFTPDMQTPEAGYYPAGTEPKEALPVGRAGANYVSDSDGMALKETTKQYTQKDAYSDIAREAAVVGGRKGAVEAMQFKSAARASDIEEKFDASMNKLNTTLATIQGTAESGGLKGLSEAAKKEGLKVEYVEGKNGVGKINVLGPKGDVLETVTNLGDATSKLEQLAMKNFMNSNLSLLGSYDKVAAYMQGNRKLDIDERTAKDKGEYYGSEAELNRARIKALNQPKAARKEVSNSDIKAFITEFGGSPSNVKDPKTGLAIPINQLPLNQQAAYATEFYLGTDATGGGLPDVPKGGLSLEKPKPKAALPEAPKYVPPKGSPAAKYKERQEAAASKQAAIDVESKRISQLRSGLQGVRNLAEEFDKDVKILPKSDLIAKYGKGGRGLTDEQVLYLND